MPNPLEISTAEGEPVAYSTAGMTMQATGSPPAHDEILRGFQAAGLYPEGITLSLSAYPGNAARRDYFTRQNYVVQAAQKAAYFLTVGTNSLESLWQRSRGFADACPSITCRPLHRIKGTGWEAIVFEHFDGVSLASALGAQKITKANAADRIAEVERALAATARASTKDQAEKELDALLERACSLPIFAGFDQRFLRDALFPLIRRGAQTATSTRWTNGDLIPRNVLVNASGGVRLVDYEFAGRTHFPQEDGWRWRTFAETAALKQLPVFGGASGEASWVEALFLIRQLVLACEINGAHLAVPDSKPAIDRLIALVAEANDGFRGSIFLQALTLRPKMEEAVTETLRLTKLVQRRDRQLARIESSISWRIAALCGALPRWIRRLSKPKFTYFIEVPREWDLVDTPTALTLRGWCFTSAPMVIEEIRLQAGGRTYSGEYGRERIDVGQSHPDHPQAYRSGFRVPFELRPGDTSVEVSVLDERGEWHRLFRCDLAKAAAKKKTLSYDRWVRLYDTLTPGALSWYQGQVAALARKPRISILLPVYNTPAHYLRQVIESVLKQVYPYWELCIADDASSHPHVRPILERYAALDGRIKLLFRETNGHIGAASNSALSIATGEYVAMLDHDDELRPHALAEVAAAINRRPETELLYSDEDKIDEDGYRFDPYFKPEYSPELLAGHNYLCHFCVCRAETVRAVGGWRPGVDGAQDWDLEWRVIERTAPDRVVRIPRILYHWRAVTGSTALATSEKSYSVGAARKALQEHFERTGERPELIHLPGNHWRVKHPVPAPAPLVSLLIPTRNGLDYLRRCLTSIFEKTTYPAYEVIVMDNGSDDPAALKYLQNLASASTGAFRSPPRAVRVVSHPGEFNYAAINNAAVKLAQGEFVALLNNDLEVITPEWLEELVSQAARRGVGCVGPMLYFPNETLQHAGVVLGIGGVAGHAFKGFRRGSPGYMNLAKLTQNRSVVTGACLLVKKSIYQEAGGLDDRELKVSLNDVDFCLKVRAAGYRNVWTPFAELYHHESVTRGYEDTPEKKERFERERNVMKQRWGALLLNDPAYNPNLTLDSEDFALAHPPRVEVLPAGPRLEITPTRGEALLS